MPRAWIFQEKKQVAKLGAARASWCVGWYDPAGKRKRKSCGQGAAGKKAAFRLCEKIKGELVTETYDRPEKATWDEFCKEYATRILDGQPHSSREQTEYALKAFGRLVKPRLVVGITSRLLADFTARRRKEPGKKPGSIVSPATVNKELRELRTVIRKAHKWGYLPKLPEFEFLKQPEKLPTYVLPEHFLKLYEACEHAKHPKRLPFPAADWWRALLIFAYLTGWRVGAILRLKREDVDLAEGMAVSRHADNKAKRDARVPLHPLIVEHLHKLAGFSPTFFPWRLNPRALWVEFARIQAAAGIKPEGGKDHYGFHDLRRAFATMNADRLTADALQHLMQHRDYQTTKRYINMARQMNPTVENLYVPDLKPRAQENA